MSENLNNNKPKINVPRPSLSWLYVIIALVFGFLYFSSEDGSASKEITYTEFKEMVSKGYASKIIAYDDNTVDMFIKPENIVDVFGKDANKVGRSPSVNVKIGSMEALDKFLDEEQDSSTDRTFPRFLWGNTFEQTVFSKQHAGTVSTRIVYPVEDKNG